MGRRVGVKVGWVVAVGRGVEVEVGVAVGGGVRVGVAVGRTVLVGVGVAEGRRVGEAVAAEVGVVVQAWLRLPSARASANGVDSLGKAAGRVGEIWDGVTVATGRVRVE